MELADKDVFKISYLKTIIKIKDVFKNHILKKGEEI